MKISCVGRVLKDRVIVELRPMNILAEGLKSAQKHQG
jgi:hypothetical protein